MVQHALSARFVQGCTEPGQYADGGNLYFVVGPGTSRRWSFIYRRDGKRTELGLGSAREVPLAKARERAAELRRMLADGTDPKMVRNAKKLRPATFGDV